MNFCVAPREIWEINKRGGQNKLWGVSKNHEKINVPPVYFEPESSILGLWVYNTLSRTMHWWFCRLQAPIPQGIF